MAESFESVYKGIRNKLRVFDPQSVVRIVLKELKKPVDSNFEDLGRIPWHLLLIVKWSLQDQMAGTQVSKAATLSDIENIKAMIWNIPSKVARTDFDKTPFNLFMRRQIYVQAEFQKGVTKGFFREIAILNDMPSNSSLVKRFENDTGLTPSEYNDFSTFSFIAVYSGKTTFAKTYFNPLVSIHGAGKLEKYIDCVSADFNQLETYLRSLPDCTNKVASEFYEFPVIARFPFYRYGDTLHCWHPSVFMRGAERMVHSILSEHGHNYIDRYSKVFESHVIRSTHGENTPIIDEANLITLLPSDSKVVDGLIPYPDANVYIEVKSGLYAEPLMTVGERRVFSHKTKSLIKGMEQAWAVSEGLRARNAATENVLNNNEEYLIIVTNRELTAGTGKKLLNTYPDETIQFPDTVTLNRLPLENIYVVSIEDYERLIEAANCGLVYLPKFLAQCKKNDSSVETNVFFMQQHLDNENLPMRTSKLVHDCFQDTFENLANILGGDLPALVDETS